MKEYCDEKSVLPPHASQLNPPKTIHPLNHAAMDAMTTRQCVDPATSLPIGGLPDDVCPASAAGHSHAAREHQLCVDAGGVCAVLRDGFYPVAGVSIALGAAILLWLRATLPGLDALPLAAWHARADKAKTS